MGLKEKVKSAIYDLKKPKLIPIIKPDTGKLLEGKNALIIGGCGGIGSSIVKEFLESGANVVVVGTSEEKTKSLLNQFKSFPIKAIVFDVLNFHDYHSLIQDSFDCFGTIDIMVNAAGTHTSYKNFDFLNVTTEEYDRVLAINLKSNYFLVQEFAKTCIEKGIRSHILLVSSQRGLEPSWSPYRLSKRGLDGFVAGAAKKLLPFGIIVNGIGPGSTNTSLINYKDGDSIYTDDNPLHRLVTIDEVAFYSKILVSSLGDSFVGQVIYPTGGGGIIEIK